MKNKLIALSITLLAFALPQTVFCSDSQKEETPQEIIIRLSKELSKEKKDREYYQRRDEENITLRGIELGEQTLPVVKELTEKIPEVGKDLTTVSQDIKDSSENLSQALKYSSENLTQIIKPAAKTIGLALGGGAIGVLGLTFIGTGIKDIEKSDGKKGWWTLAYGAVLVAAGTSCVYFGIK